MAVSTISVTGSAPPTAFPQAAQSFGGDTFMKLLLAQLQHQDPLNPMKDNEFITQTALMNTVQQLETLNAAVAASSLNQSLAAAAALIGKTVTAGSPGGTPLRGVVTGISVQGKQVMLHIGAAKVPLSSLLSVEETNGR